MDHRAFTPYADAITDFFQWLYEEMIEIEHLDAIYEIAKREKVKTEPKAFVRWYKSTFGEDEDD